MQLINVYIVFFIGGAPFSYCLIVCIIIVRYLIIIIHDLHKKTISFSAVSLIFLCKFKEYG